MPKKFRVLLISGFQKHKNIPLLPKIAAALKRQWAMDDVSFVITLPPQHDGTKQLIAEADSLNVDSMIYNFGPVPETGCAELYSAVDAVILPSAIESFSNTIAEAWSMRKPLLISDLDWARSACGDGAIYFNYNDPNDAASKIVQMRQDAAAVERLLEAGSRMLGTYSTSEQRFLEYLSIIESRHRREIRDDAAGVAPEAPIVQRAR
jgi:glycosyltransferase involved in cell wall biosynthesis